MASVRDRFDDRFDDKFYWLLWLKVITGRVLIFLISKKEDLGLYTYCKIVSEKTDISTQTEPVDGVRYV